LLVVPHSIETILFQKQLVLGMENHRIYGQNARKHHNRTKIENLSEDYINMITRFNKLCENVEIADVGCGTGRDLKYMHENLERGAVSYGIDASIGMIEFARTDSKSNLTQYIASDMTKLPFSDSQLGGIWCQATIFMVGLQNMKKALQEFKRVLNPSGVLSVSFKLSDHHSSKNGEQVRERYGSKIDYYFVDDDKAVQIVDEAGFNVFEVNKSGFEETEFINIWSEAE